jgi:excisionase family DNA binding protein
MLIKDTPNSVPQGATSDQPDMGHRLLRADEVADHLQVSKSYVYALIQRGELPCIALGRAVRVRPEAVEEFLKAKERHSRPPLFGSAA